MDLRDGINETIKGRPLLVLAKVGNRKCENKKNFYLLYDEYSLELKPVSLTYLYNVGDKVRNAKVYKNTKGLPEIELLWCSTKKLPIVNIIDNRITSIKGGIWVLRRYRDGSGDTFDIVDQSGKVGLVTIDKLWRIKNTNELVNASMTDVTKIVRGTMKPVPTVDTTVTKKELKDCSTSILVKPEKFAVVIKVDNNNLECKFKITAKSISMDLIRRLYHEDDFEYIDKFEDSKAVIVTIRNDMDKFTECIKKLMNGVTIYNLNINYFVSNITGLESMLKLSNQLRVGVVGSNNLIERDLKVSGSLPNASKNDKTIFNNSIICYHNSLLNTLSSLKVIDRRCMNLLLKEYVEAMAN